MKIAIGAGARLALLRRRMSCALVAPRIEGPLHSVVQ